MDYQLKDILNIPEVQKLRQAEVTLQKVFSEMQGLLDASAAGLARINRNLNYIIVNDAYAKLVGMSREQIIGKSLAEVIGKKRLAAITPNIERAFKGERIEYEIEVPFEFSGARYLHTVFTPYGDDLGDITGLVASVTDITERKNAEIKLRESEENYRNFTGLTSDYVHKCTRTGTAPFRVRWIGGSVGSISGYSAEEIHELGCWLPLVHPDDRQEMSSYLLSLVPGDLKQKEFRMITKEGQLRWLIETSRCEAGYGEGELILYGAVKDNTERKKLEEDRIILEQQFQQAQKMESLGVLAGGIAHDFNNLLAVIIGRCSLARLRPITAFDHIPEIETAAERAAELCQQMLAYAGKGNITKSQVHLEELVTEMIKMSRSTIGLNVILTYDVSSDIPAILADASQVRQITMNLIINAAEAIGKTQGEVRVALGKTVISAAQREKDHLGSIIPPNTYACLEVTDNGCGMDSETQRRMFEPFFTTKFTGRGLGMSAVLGIIKSHDGALQFFSQPAKGTTFKVYLPALMTASAENQSRRPDNQPAPWMGRGTVLLVEDNEHVMCIAETMLEELGFTVIKAYDGREGLERYQQNAESIELVITDIGMPIMDGHAMINELQELKPELPIIISSGFGDADITSRIAVGKISGHIGKPYNFRELSELLKNILEKQAQPAHGAD